VGPAGAKPAGLFLFAEAEPMNADPGGNITLELSCDKCGHGINLWCEGWDKGGPAHAMTFACPSCGANQRTEIPATRVSASRRDDHSLTNIVISTIFSGL
jgi:hypothetical protein